MDSIFDAINASKNEMKRIRKVETQINDAKAQQETDKGYSCLVQDVSSFVKALCFAEDELEFAYPEEIRQDSQMLLRVLLESQQTGLVEKESVRKASSDFAQIKKRTGEEWVRRFTAFKDISDTLLVIQSIDNARSIQCQRRINDAAQWNSSSESLRSLKNALAEAEEIISSLNLDEDIMTFLTKMSCSEATIAILNKKILDWIIANDLGERIKLSFR